MKKILAVTLSTLMILATATGCLKRVDPNSASDAVIGGNSGDEIDKGRVCFWLTAPYSEERQEAARKFVGRRDFGWGYWG